MSLNTTAKRLPAADRGLTSRVTGRQLAWLTLCLVLVVQTVAVLLIGFTIGGK